MNKFIQILIIFVLFISSGVYAQDSWINVQLQTDNYPEETSWGIFNISGGAIAASDSALAELTLYDTVIDVLSGLNITVPEPLK